jgi:hypothetical protein
MRNEKEMKRKQSKKAKQKETNEAKQKKKLKISEKTIEAKCRENSLYLFSL